MTDHTALKEAAEAATPGPWRDRAEKHYKPDGLIYGPDDEYDGDYRIIGSLKGRKGFGSVHWSQYTIPNAKQGYANAHFIALANPSKILELLAENEALRERIDELEEAISEIGAFAHNNSTGPAVLDAFWSIRDMAYRPLETREQTDARIKVEVEAEQ